MVKTTTDAVKILRKKFYDGNPERTAELEKELERLRRLQDGQER